jgi:hypothetical protein
MAKIVVELSTERRVIKALTYAELIEMVNAYFHYNRRVEFVGGPFKCEIKGQILFCQKITVLVN